LLSIQISVTPFSVVVYNALHPITGRPIGVHPALPDGAAGTGSAEAHDAVTPGG